MRQNGRYFSLAVLILTLCFTNPVSAGNSPASGNAGTPAEGGVRFDELLERPELIPPVEEDDILTLPGDEAEKLTPLEIETMRITAILGQLPPDIYEDVMEEAKRAEDECELDFRQVNLFNCSCVGMMIAGKRLEEGPDTNYYFILRGTDFTLCMEDYRIAGHAYQRCNLLEPDTANRAEICTCSSRGTVERLTSVRNASYANFQAFFSDAYIQCSILDRRQRRTR